MAVRCPDDEQVLGILHAVHSLLVFFNVLAPRLLVTNAGLVGQPIPHHAQLHELGGSLQVSSQCSTQSMCCGLSW